MKKILTTAAILLAASCATLSAQSIAQKFIDRYSDPDNPKAVFIGKGNYSTGFTASYHSFDASGEKAGDGYSILSLLNIGDGFLAKYDITLGASFFVADDISLGLSLDWGGYQLKSDLKLDFRDVVGLGPEAAEDPDLAEALQLLNLQISSRDMVHNDWGTSLNLRKFISFFGSQTVAIFGEGRLYGNYGTTVSRPLDKQTGLPATGKDRVSNSYTMGLKLGGGLCIKLRDNSALTLSVPVVGVSYSETNQHKEFTGNDARLRNFAISRDLDYIAVKVGYTRFIQPKNRKKKE